MIQSLNSASMILFFSFLMMSTPGLTQTGIDCLTAIEVNSSDTITINREFFEGSLVEMTDQSCFTNGQMFDLDYNTLWFRYEFCSSGDFLFKVIPDSLTIDIDFVLFKSENANCENLVGIRCMLSGENVGPPIDSTCIGQTGLSYQSLDTVETAGCQVGDDNFLSPVNVQTGDVLYLAVASFSGLNLYSIVHDGTATFDCHTTSINEVQGFNLNIYPNPTEDYFIIEEVQSSRTLSTAEIYRLDGTFIQRYDLKDSSRINVDFLEPGMYLLVVYDTSGQSSVEKISLLRT